MPPDILQATGISKSFPGVHALKEVNLHLAPGEVLAVVGENGAGKSTLMKVLGGVYTPDAGHLEVNGQPASLATVHAAERHGIVLIHQELNLAEQLDVAGNIFLGREPTRFGILRLLDPRIYTDAEAIMRRLGLTCSSRELVANLSIGQQQLVEIARALSLRSRILILDEPTSSLTERETERLFQVIGDLKRDGIAVIYISHRLKEVQQIADRVTVLRDGRNAGELTREQINHEAIVRLMVGRSLQQFFHRESKPETEEHRTILRVRDLRWSSAQQPISFTLRSGEIVGMAGLMGSGRTELAETLFGIRRQISGEVKVDGQHASIRHPNDAVARGIFLIPEDRRLQGLVLPMSVKDNISLASLDKLSRFSLVSPRRERELATAMSAKLNIRSAGYLQTVDLLSGGNQQKVVLAKWLNRTARVLILDEPTRGIDVGAKSEIYALMDRLAGEGLAILMISSDLEEILGMSDRVLVMHDGSLAGELSRQQVSEEAIMNLATGNPSGHSVG